MEAKETNKEVITSITSITSISDQIDGQVALVLADKSVGIAKALVIAKAMQIINQCLTPEIMEPIMQLQGSKLGFKTDKDLMKDGNGNYIKGPGYALDVVKNCFTEMSLIGLQPVFNQWNIIGGNSYVTKEGADILLKNIPYLQEFLIIHDEVIQSPDKKNASVKSTIKWTIEGEEHTQEISHPVKSDPYTSLDSLIGKADRKTKIWLFNKIKGTTISDGDAEDAKIIDVTPSKPNNKVVDDAKTRKRVLFHIAQSTTLENLQNPDFLKSLASLGDDAEVLIQLEDKKRELTPKK
jgi:hypothetical protein